MPRRRRAARERVAEPLPAESVSAGAPAWASAPGYEVRVVSGTKPYRCPGCDMEIRAGVGHFVVMPEDEATQRRHWHTNCWRQELRRTRGRA